MTSRLSAIKDAKQNLSFQSDKLGRAIAAAKNEVQESEAMLISTKEQAEDMKNSTQERLERTGMRVEELITGLHRTRLQTDFARSRVHKHTQLIPPLQLEKAKEKKQDEMIEICLLLLNDSLEFFERNQERSAFIVKRTQGEFVDVLKNLKEACFSAVDADRAFHEQATTDPRELLPYSRSQPNPFL